MKKSASSPKEKKKKEAEGTGGMDDGETPTKKKKSSKSLGAGGSSSSSPPATALASDGAFCSFPMSRVWRLVRGECGVAAAAEIRTTADAVFIINKASEMFLQRLTEDAYTFAKSENKKFISYNHLSSTVNRTKRYEFLSGIINWRDYSVWIPDIAYHSEANQVQHVIQYRAQYRTVLSHGTEEGVDVAHLHWTLDGIRFRS